MTGHGNTGVVYGDEGMGQRDNFKGGEGGRFDYKVPYTYVDDPTVPAYGET